MANTLPFLPSLPPSFSTTYPATRQLLSHTLPAPCPPQRGAHAHVPWTRKRALGNRRRPAPQRGTRGLDACPHVLGVRHDGLHCTGGAHSVSCWRGMYSPSLPLLSHHLGSKMRPERVNAHDPQDPTRMMQANVALSPLQVCAAFSLFFLLSVLPQLANMIPMWEEIGRASCRERV